MSTYQFDWHANDDKTEYTCRLEWPVEGMEPLVVEIDNRIEPERHHDGGPKNPKAGRVFLAMFFYHRCIGEGMFASTLYDSGGISDFGIYIDPTTPALLRAIADAAETLLPLAWECRPFRGTEE